MPLAVRFRFWIDNLVSRLFGAVVRSMTLVAGLFVTFLTVVGVALSWILWLGLPFLILVMLGGGVKLLIGSVV